jgi:predicted Fe-Mo cluster-binding NifX family protein
MKAKTRPKHGMPFSGRRLISCRIGWSSFNAGLTPEQRPPTLRPRISRVRLAIATENGQVCAHFGHSPSFTIVDFEDGAILEQHSVPSPDHEPGRIPLFLKEQGAEVVVSGGMGRKAATIFDRLGIRQIVGVTGSIEAAIAGCLDGTIEGGGSLCSHTDGEHHRHH